jgi:hypothetical protein
MTLALIKNNIIENIIKADDELVAVNYPSYFVMRIDTIDPVPGIGDTYADGIFIKPPVEEQNE